MIRNIVLLATVLSSACAVRETVVETPTSAEVEVASDPPPERVEVVAVAPSPEHVFIRGHWRWERGWVWEAGHWEVRRAGHEFVVGHWARRPRGWLWVPGHWRRV